ncbi:lanthionine synthetase LanC family protein [Streptomyces sp. NPDC049881]|uniref:lanthionine synthetase LanC family protein n=1 Tax=Streptomyces sp. NPDC049881 TaxID=3155778 RepID=UPI0034369951
MSNGIPDIIDRAVRAVADPDQLTVALGPARAATLHDGLAGIALTLAVLAGQDPPLARTASRHWDAAAGLAKGTEPDGIYRGPGALATSLILGNGYIPHGHRRNSDTGRATAWLSARACGLARHRTDRVRQGHPGTPWAVYDSMRGLAGIGRVLLAAAETGHREAAEPGLKAALATLTDMINQPTAPYPGWWLPQHEHHPCTTVPESGAATTGLAHGIAGPLALLAIAAGRDVRVPGQSDAIHAAATWLRTWRTAEGTWPARISGSALARPDAPLTAGSSRRDAWCYGNAGIGNALIHAGTALSDRTMTTWGHDALEAVTRRPVGQWDTTGAGICHGTAGVLLTAAAHGNTTLGRKAAEATTAGLAATDAHSSDLGLLTGSAGAALALSGLSATHPPGGANWPALLLLT